MKQANTDQDDGKGLLTGHATNRLSSITSSAVRSHGLTYVGGK